jgi:hypothetical protein
MNFLHAVTRQGSIAIGLFAIAVVFTIFLLPGVEACVSSNDCTQIGYECRSDRITYFKWGMSCVDHVCQCCETCGNIIGTCSSGRVCTYDGSCGGITSIDVFCHGCTSYTECNTGYNCVSGTCKTTCQINSDCAPTWCCTAVLGSGSQCMRGATVGGKSYLCV